MRRRIALAFMVGIAASVVPAAAWAQGGRASGAADPIGELILLSSDQSDRLVVFFEDRQAVLTDASKVRLREFAERIKHVGSRIRRVLVVGTAPRSGDPSADQDLAIRRGLAARDDLARLSGLPASTFLVQASRSPANWRSSGRIVIEFSSDAPSASHRAGRVQAAWDAEAQRWVLVCGDGTVLPAQPSAPDDFFALADCPAAVASPGPPTPSAAGTRAVARWESRTARWVLRCPDGSPLTGQMQDPDDFHALSRCRP